MNHFPFYRQLDAMGCGPACLRMISSFYGRHYTTETLIEKSGFGKMGVSLLGISEASEKIGFRTRGLKISYEDLVNKAILPCILHWQQNHFVVLIKCKRYLFWKREQIIIVDPAKGKVKYTKKEFIENWLSSVSNTGAQVGTVLLLEPTPVFFEYENEKKVSLQWSQILQYLRKSNWQIVQVFIAFIITSFLQLTFPFLTQSIVDVGINTQNINYITLVLTAQMMLIFSKTIVDFVRAKLLMRISVIISLSILSDFWIKLTKLPIAYFERHHTGDTIQRLNDNKQIQNFLSGSALSTFFSLFNFIIYAFVLVEYNPQLFLIFISGSGLYFMWIRVFLRIRRKINYQTFQISAKENDATLQLVQGMQEIKLHNAEQLKRWEWENIQVGVFKLNLKSLNYSQFQQAGALFFNQGKDVLITFIVAKLVIEGSLTFGAMLAVQYIIGQLSGPIEQFVGFVQSAQDARISLERLNEIHQLKDEEDKHRVYVKHLPDMKNICISSLSFTYPSTGSGPVLHNITLEIPEGRVTAIVGASGSGKTTLLKLLLKFYEVYDGDIKIGEINIRYISPSWWRCQCGAVLQDGYIFNDTIARNIGVGDEVVEHSKLIQSCKMANILSFIESLPNGFYTKLGAEGVGISQGQKQRLLIARAIYKDPAYLFFDEATNALDANNEKAIVENLEDFFKGRTVVVVAHRLSTVKNADKIIVLHNGAIAEVGTHEELSNRKGKYYELVKNQLEFGN